MKLNFASALHTDQYQITMMFAHWKQGSHTKKRAFDLYFRTLPFGNGYAVFAGLERAITYLQNVRFTEEDLSYIQSLSPSYDAPFLEYLRQFRFTGDLYAFREGSLIFPNEPIMRLEGNVNELHLIETALLNFTGFQTLVATKAARIRHIVGEKETLMEFGTRRAQEADAAVWGARAAYISGFNATSNVLAGKTFGIPTSGTHAHAWVQDFSSELEAFRAYADAFPDQAVLLVDTYDTLKSGVPHAIQVGLELREKGHTLKGIRLDSGDLAYLSKQARIMLDEAGLTDTKIVASNDLDEQTILNLRAQGAQIDSWGVGTKLITAHDQPSLGCVYKMVSRLEENQWIPTLKISSNPIKVSTPGRKKIVRIIDSKTNKAQADYIMEVNEELNPAEPLMLIHPVHSFKKKTIQNYRIEPLHVPIFQEGNLVYSLPILEEIRQFHQQQMDQFWEEYLRILNPEEYTVNLSDKLWETKRQLLDRVQEQVQNLSISK
ncbi:nicotinate phosphoribosyltransferase [Croceifilum oryzae]|uniref:Nicotinate phosphoribosyltransferase n=1 Tax=Croceifilum oryzae TaxID=1553429 RepID=A0AAJ1TCX4_9BACL|nr:nicotinate phosphoribosyltransferase [Croceifilum oryzae]MDQ0416508.1 nicotinate phosphoribosyltransferase [Croceifilum oryzae]